MSDDCLMRMCQIFAVPRPGYALGSPLTLSGLTLLSQNLGHTKITAFHSFLCPLSYLSSTYWCLPNANLRSNRNNMHTVHPLKLLTVGGVL